jgi:hypothetical protein
MKRSGGAILKVGSFAEVIYKMDEMGTLRRRQRVLLVMDESAMITGVRGGAGSGMQTKEGAMVAAFNTQIRKLSLAILIVGIGDRFLAGMYRTGEGNNMITGTFRRVKRAGYDAQEVIAISTSTQTRPEPEYVRTTPIRGIARPQSLLETPDGDNGPVFESFSPATFSMGKFRSGKPFEIDALLIAMSDTISERSADAIARFLRSEGREALEKVEPIDASKVSDDNPVSKKEGELVLTQQADKIRVLIDTTNLGDSDIAHQVGVSRQRVHAIRKEMRKS